MSEVRTVWHMLEERRATAASRHRSGVLLVAALLCAMAAAEVVYLRFVVGPDSVDLTAAALMG